MGFSRSDSIWGLPFSLKSCISRFVTVVVCFSPSQVSVKRHVFVGVKVKHFSWGTEAVSSGGEGWVQKALLQVEFKTNLGSL